MANHAPIAVFCYRRPEHLRNTLRSLMQCEGFQESPVFVFGDGPRNEAEHEAVQAARDTARELLGERARYRFSPVNRGLSESVISGVDEILKDHERVIVIEDDLVLDRWFLMFMNDALDRYADAERVFQVSGHMFDVPEIRDRDAALFFPLTSSWGWATWRRAWSRFDAAATGWKELFGDKELRLRFNLDGAYDYASMLEAQMNGKRDSWAIRWYWSVFRADGLVLFPPVSMVQNKGLDGSGTHGRGWFRNFGQAGHRVPAACPGLPGEPALDELAFTRLKAALKRRNGGWRAGFLNRVRYLLDNYPTQRKA